MASPSAVSWMSHSIAKFPDIAARAAPGLFSMMPRARSCRPRWATGRAVSQSGVRKPLVPSGDFENALDFHGSVRGEDGNADRGAGMAALVAERRDHQVGGAVEHFRTVEEIRCGIHETAKPDHAHHLVEVPERGLDLRQQVDRAATCRRNALLDRDAGPQLALGDQLALRIDADLPRNEQQVSSADKADIIRHGGGGLMQCDALCRQFLLDRARHVSSPVDFTKTRSSGPLVSRIVGRVASEGRSAMQHLAPVNSAESCVKTWHGGTEPYFFVNLP